MTHNAVEFFVDRHVNCGRAGNVAILHADDEITYGQLADAINQAGNYLLRQGVAPEQRVALLLHDSPAFIYFFMAALKIGAVAVPIGTSCDAKGLAHFLADTRAPVLVTHSEYAKRVQSIRDALPQLKHVAYIEHADWRAEPSELQTFEVCADDSAFWLYTSGSGGMPKAVVHRHASMMECAQNYGRNVLRIAAEDRCYSTSKMFFAYGLGNSVIFPFSVGASCVLHDGRNDPDVIASLIKRHQPTLFFSVPTLYEQLLACPAIDSNLFKGVRMCLSAGEYLPESLFDSWLARTAKIPYDGIGSTEAMHIFCSNRPETHKKGTSGVPVEGYELRIMDDHGNPVASGEIGHLQVRGKTLAKGYWNSYETTQNTFQGAWLATGDIYQQTEDGLFKYIGRQGDAFKSSGLWVSPVEIEQLLLEHPSVTEAGVVAAKSASGRFVAKAFVVTKSDSPKPDDEALMQDIYAYLKERLPRYKVPQGLEVLPSLPKTPTGKIARAELRRMA